MYFVSFTETSTTEIYTLSLHDALPICQPEVTLDQQTQTPQPVGEIPDQGVGLQLTADGRPLLRVGRGSSLSRLRALPGGACVLGAELRGGLGRGGGTGGLSRTGR